MDNGFSGKEGQRVPEMTETIVNSISERYIELFEHITGTDFCRSEDSEDIYERIETNINNMLARL